MRSIVCRCERVWLREQLSAYNWNTSCGWYTRLKSRIPAPWSHGHCKIEAMTMSYKVDDAAILKKVKPGDQIAATVYEGDTSLHKVRVVPPKATGEKKK